MRSYLAIVANAPLFSGTLYSIPQWKADNIRESFSIPNYKR